MTLLRRIDRLERFLSTDPESEQSGDFLSDDERETIRRLMVDDGLKDAELSAAVRHVLEARE